VKRQISIDLFDEHEKVNFYTVCFHDEKSEFDKFLDEYDNSKYIDQINLIVSDIDTIGKKGAFSRDFRQEGKPNDNLCALPSNWVTCKLRVFCLRIAEDIVILGNGYEKTKRTYNEIPFALYYANTLLSVDRLLKRRIANSDVTHYQGLLYGNVTFTIEDERPEEE